MAPYISKAPEKGCKVMTKEQPGATFSGATEEVISICVSVKWENNKTSPLTMWRHHCEEAEGKEKLQPPSSTLAGCVQSVVLLLSPL